MFMLDIKDYAWWYWLVSTICLWLTLTALPDAYAWAMAIALIQLLHFRWVEGSFSRFPVQVRLAYLTYLVLAMPANLEWILWLPAVGGVARVLFGYCLLARILMLLPNNRQEGITWQLVLDTFLTPPVRGSLLNEKTR